MRYETLFEMSEMKYAYEESEFSNFNAAQRK